MNSLPLCPVVLCHLACVAGGISRTSAFVLAAKLEREWRRRERIGEGSREFHSRLRRSQIPSGASPAR